ncbi:lysosomal acid phosphatase-like [Sabethes cyaneus]|uniref:lysosomal acid phosphatase-like n=1 Tax=Sabethes cyaneus TaxID=53552 RepID=UPI00237E45E7|nr:lysosomal acid phosphatase-like [Sabethes cyaneus]
MHGMWMIKCYLLLLLQCSYAVIPEQRASDDSLVMLIAIFRHGVRSPITTFPTDPNANYPWVGGFEALQPEGFAELHLLGENMRKRYGRFIPKRTADMKRKIYAASSCSERCIDSAHSFLKGLLAGRRQPVPIHVILPDEDTFLIQNRTCPKARQVWKQLGVEPDSEYFSLFKEAEELKEFVSKEIGEPIKSLRDLVIILDSLEVFNTFHLQQPAWADQVFPQRVRPLILGFLRSYTGSDELKLIRGGAILTELIDKMRAKRDGQKEFRRRMVFYSGHDLTQVSLFNSLGVKDMLTRRPECGSAVVFELHKNNIFWRDLEVRMLYYANSNVSVPVKLSIPACPEPCPLTLFEQSVEHLLLADYDKTCQL